MSFILAGLILGLYAGLTPGPTLTLVLSETLQHGTKGGLQVALSPLATDTPIVILALLVMGQVGQFNTALGIMALIGAVVLIWMGYENLRTQHITLNPEAKSGASLKKGMVVNLLNPHPYLFWFPIGAPLVYQAAQQSAWYVVGFLGAFYLLLIGSKIGLALIVGRFRNFLTGTLYLNLVRGLGLVLWVFAGVMGYEGWHLLATTN